MVGELAVRVDGRISKLGPRTENMVRDGGPGGIGSPPGASGTDEIIASFVLENARGFHPAFDEHPFPYSGESGEVFREE
ncbi:hypothetical protein SDC9_212217 [bioreactor metagenome]|uniref:Uncharacterized protein n=1 Tax=bioreactor metagenome TaxID=1076179 RepID=A0A645JLA1_9ZZZZ